MNGYPRSFMKKVKAVKRKENNLMHCPCCNSICVRNKRIMRNYGIRTAFKSTHSGQQLTKVKDRIKKEERTGVIYKLRCICGEKREGH